MRGIDGLILAGGRASRMGGGDKTLLRVGEQPILTRIVTTLSPQVDALVLNANGDPSRFAAFGLPVIPDTIVDAGPLAGLLAGLEWIAAHRPQTRTVASVTGDAPFLPHDLVATLAARLSDAPIVLAASGARLHPTIGLWPVEVRGALRHFLAGAERRSVRAFAETIGFTTAAWAAAPIDPFMNVNTAADLAIAAESALVSSPRTNAGSGEQ